MRGVTGGGRCGLWLLLVVLGVAAAGCAATPGESDKEAVPAPEWRVGDRWVFRRTTGSGDVALVTHRVSEDTAEGYVLRIGGLTRELTTYWTRELHFSRQLQAGTPVRRFEPAAQYFAFPLKLKQSWTQEFDYWDGQHDGRYTNTWRVGPDVERVDVLGGTFYAVRIEHSGARGERLDTYWYVPKVRYWVKLESYFGGYTEELLEYSLSSP